MKRIILFIFVSFLGACTTDAFIVTESLPPVIESNTIETEVTQEAAEEIEEDDVLEEMNYPFDDAMDELLDLGRIAVISNSMNPLENYPFLEGLDATIYNELRLVTESNYDTLVIFYEANLLNFYPPMNWNVPAIEVGQLLRRTVRGKNIIMGRFESFEKATNQLQRFDVRLLTLQEDSTFDDFLTWQAMTPINPDLIPSLDSVTENISPAITNSQLNGVTLPPDACKLRQRSRRGHSDVFGFPIQTMISHVGTIDVAVVAVDFDDYPGDPALIDVLAKDLPLMVPWSDYFSGGAMTYQVHFSDQWVRAPKNAEWYRSRDAEVPDGYQGSDKRILSRLQSQEQSVSQLISASDDLIDWSIVDVVIFIFPVDSYDEQTHLYLHMGTFQSPSKGTVRFPVWGENFYELSRFTPQITYWDWSVHEIMHWQGLVGHGPLNHSDYSIMTNQYASTAGLHAWEAFLLGWWDDSDFTCIDYKKLEDPLVFKFDSIDQLGSDPGNKSLMIPLNDSEILVMEYRTQGEWSSLDSIFEGILIYYIDVNGKFVRCDQCDQLEIEQENFWRILRNTRIMPCSKGFVPHCGYPSIVQKPGDRLTFRNFEFEILDSNVISISIIN